MTVKLSSHSEEILRKRYCMKNTKGEIIEEPEQVFRRVAIAVAKAEPENKRVEYEEKFFDLISSLRFMPNSPALSNAGARTGQLAACFVLPIEDSMVSILQAQMELGQIQSTGGGTGFSFSRLRPAGDSVSSTNGFSSGPLSFLKMFDSTSEAIKQGGTRRGANMGILRVDHPDIVEFVKCKDKEGVITNFNLSIGITDAFMEAVVSGNKQWELINPKGNTVWKTVDARELFDLIVHHAWKNGEPGVIFLDTINNDSAVRPEYEIESTNPCAEQPLPPYDVCNLGSVNLSSFVKGVGAEATFDIESFSETVELGVRFLDDVIDVCKYPLKQITEMAHTYRRIGLGIMGFADALVLMKIPYSDNKAFEFIDMVGGVFQNVALESSRALANEKGGFSKQPETTLKDAPPQRNVAITTVAPTGTCSLIVDCSAAIEPWFAYSYEREVVGVGRIKVWNSALKKVFDSLSIKAEGLSEENIKKLIPEDWKRVLLTTLDISPANHVRIQAAFQKYIDSGISKTINMPNDATEEDVKNAFMLAHKMGCKSITVYRDGSREVQIIERDGQIQRVVEKGKTSVRKRPRITRGYIEKVPTGCGRMYVTFGADAQGLCEVFATTGQQGGCVSSWSEATCRLISLCLRSGIEISSIVKQLRGNKCGTFTFDGEHMRVFSCSDALAQAVLRYEENKEQIATGESDLLKLPSKFNHVEDVEEIETGAPITCPECQEKLVMESGCFVCKRCGYSKC